MNTQKIREIFSKLQEENFELEYLRNNLYEGVIFNTEEVSGGEGKGDEYSVVISTKEEDGKTTYWQIPGYYASHYGSEIEVCNTFEVESAEQVVQYWKAK